ncbi:metallophosphoesterase [Luteolibacter pohnpeiensis]|uniref:Metallophosphoesterase n=2 Tax=Luteolibacter pohnpeiensis TaxID=454153 RepID=A0A934VV50_9BACT|nr:metallophosphoesterase [Luteolibacter pohnpeiensis]
MSPLEPTFTRRRLIKTLFCSSLAMQLNLNSTASAEMVRNGDLDFMVLGDFGAGNNDQKKVAEAMDVYARRLGKKADGMFLLGDNFYGAVHDGVKSERWKTGFSDLYPSRRFPNPCWAVLGNHDYHDTIGGAQMQLDYNAFRKGKTRWTMPDNFYRVDLPAKDPKVTFLMIDTNWEPINRRTHGANPPCWISAEKQAEQLVWLKQQLESKRAPFTVVIGHHPLYSDGNHGDTPELIKDIGPLLEKAGVHLYLGGHDHDMQHLELEGLRTSFVISGAGGAGIYRIDKPRKGAVAKSEHGFSHLSFKEDRLYLSHIGLNGKSLHAFSKGTDFTWKVEV